MSKVTVSRKSGYYWVGWSYSGDMEDVVMRIAYYNEKWQVWTVDGDSEKFTDEQFIIISPQRIDPFGERRYWLRLRFVALVLLVLNGILFIFEVYNLIK